jgi:hypothetical protein
MGTTRARNSIPLVGAIFLLGSLIYTHNAQAAGAKGSSVTQTLQRLEQRLDTVEQENRALKEQVLELKQQVTPAVTTMQQHMQEMPKTEARVTNLEKVMADSDKQLASLKEHTDSPFKGSGLGFRTGWSEVPFDLPGGFYWDAHLGHRLFEEQDGIPWGDINGELAIGLIQGNQRAASVTTLAGTPLQHDVTIRESATLALVSPTVRYTLRRLEPFEPTLVAGPEILINVFETRPLNAGQLPLPPQLRQKGIPTIGSGHVFAGGVFGVDLQYRLSDVAAALNMHQFERFFSKITLGPEWRYHAMENGENFNSYSGEITIGF